MRQTTRLLLLTTAFVLSAKPLRAIDVSGTLTGIQRWAVGDSPVRVTGDLELPSGCRLDIDPGVTVAFAGPYHFQVSGDLRALGEKGLPIVFTAENPAVDSMKWKGLRFVNADRDCRLNFCRIEYSWARGAWPQNSGGGIYLEGSSPTIYRCEISNNTAESDGGGIYGWFTTSTIQNSLIVSNIAGRFGGGIFVDYSSPSILNCTIALDSTTAWGGGIYVGSNGTPTITNCIINFNQQDHFLDGHDIGAGGRHFSEIAKANGADPEISFSCIGNLGLDPYTGTGNIIDDPEFLNAGTAPYDFNLKYSSPCIDTGDPLMTPGSEPDVLINRINMGHLGGTEDATISVPVIYSDLAALGVGLNYDSIRINSQLSKEIRVENRGHYRLYLNQFQFSDSAFFPDSAENEDGFMIPAYAVISLEPGERGRYNIIFRPTQLITYNGIVSIISSDTIQPAPTLDLTGTGIDPIAVLDDTLDFHARPIGAAHLDSLYIHNTGRSELRISGGTIQGLGFKVTTVDRIVVPSDSGILRFEFSPTIPQFYEAFATINTNDRSLSVVLRGSGIGPKMILRDDSLFVGYVYTGGDTAARSVTIANDGRDTLWITGVSISDPAFSVNLPAGGLAVADSDSVELQVYFHPTVPSTDYSALMILSSNYPQTDTVALSGRGMAEPGRYMFGPVDGVWEGSASSPDYIVLDSIYIAPETRLKIMPGARVLFEPDAFLQADGELRIAGLPTDSVYLLPRDPSGALGTRWGGLKLSLQDATQISYCVMRGSSYGIRLSESSPLVEFCTIADNGDTTANGGGIYLENSGARIAGCVIEANRARYGGGIYILNSIPRITNCIIRNNSAVAGGGAYLRFLVGALFQSNLIYDNQGGGLAIIEHSAPRLVNNTIVDNTGTGVFAGVRSMPVLVNNIIWGNSDSSISVDAYAHALVSFCDVQGGSEGTLNLDTDPSFDPASPLPYMLADGSPLIDKGNPELSHRDYYFPPSQGTARSDIGAYGGPLSGNWESAALEMTVFQNPAFPHWLDIYLLSQETLAQTPLCSLQVGSGAMVAIELVPLGTMVYRGAYEATSGGAVFITADAELAGGHKKVGRIFQLLLTDPAGGGGYLQMVGMDGGLTFDDGALDGQTALLAGVEPKPLQPEGQLLFLSPEFFVSGITGRLVEPGRLRLSLPGVEDWSREQLSHLGIYCRENSGWIRLEGGFRDGAIVAGVDHSGGFAIAWNEQVPSESDPPVPDAIDLIAAYPNPFNGAVSIVFDLSESADIKLTVFDLAGRETIHLAQGTFPAGEHRLVWSARDADGISLPSGIYWVRLNTGRGNRTIKLLLLR